MDRFTKYLIPIAIISLPAMTHAQPQIQWSTIDAGGGALDRRRHRSTRNRRSARRRSDDDRRLDHPAWGFLGSLSPLGLPRRLQPRPGRRSSTTSTSSPLDAEDISADFNGDQVVDFFDYLDFAAAFDAGCE